MKNTKNYDYISKQNIYLLGNNLSNNIITMMIGTLPCERTKNGGKDEWMIFIQTLKDEH